MGGEKLTKRAFKIVVHPPKLLFCSLSGELYLDSSNRDAKVHRLSDVVVSANL
jgi:hypothetical protein